MKTQLLAALLLSASIPLAAQIPNAGFESWNADTTVVDWVTNSSAFYRTALRASPGHSGSYALEGMVANISGYGIGPIIYAGPHGVIPYTHRDAALLGWYKFVPASSNDGMEITVSTFQAVTKTPVASGALLIPTASPNFKQFGVNLTYLTSATPDSAVISFTVIHGVGSDFPTPGTYFVLDDISFGSGTAVNNPAPATASTFALLQNYPNPFNPSTEISYQVPVTSPVRLAVYDLLGRELAVLVNETKAPGSYNARFDASSLASGVYMYRLEAGTFTYTRRMALVK